MTHATLLVQHGCYHCPECLYPIAFERASRSGIPGNWGTMLEADGSAIGACRNNRCERFEVRVKVKLKTIEVEVIPEENPRDEQVNNSASVGAGG